MSGHSKWSTIKRQKGANDAKRGSIFTKLGNQIAIAARNGTDPSVNSSLAMAIEKAKAANMPMANIDRAIKRVSDKNSAVLQEVMYEGYGPGGVGILVECATDNINRTYPEIRNIFHKKGGSIADSGSVSFMFERKGQIRVKASGDDAIMIVLEAGAEDAYEESGEIIVITKPKDLARVRDAIKNQNLDLISAELTYIPKNTVNIDDPEVVKKVMNLLDALDELNDVVETHTNFEIADSIEF